MVLDVPMPRRAYGGSNTAAAHPGPMKPFEVKGEAVLDVSVVRPGDLDGEEQAYWRKFLSSSSTSDSPFLALEYAQVLDRVRDHMRVAVATDGGQVVAFLPFELRGRGRAGPAGGGLSDATGIVHNAAWVPDAGAMLR